MSTHSNDYSNNLHQKTACPIIPTNKMLVFIFQPSTWIRQMTMLFSNGIQIARCTMNENPCHGYKTSYLGRVHPSSLGTEHMLLFH